MTRIFILVILLLTGAGALAATSRLDDARALALAREEARQANARHQLLEARARRATGQAERARAAGEALAARIIAAEANLTAAERRIALVDALLAEQRSRLAERQRPLVRLTAALQTMARRPAALALVQPGSVHDTVRVRSLLDAVLPEIRRRTAVLRAEVERSHALRGRSEQARAALEASREDLRQRRVDLARFEAEQRARSEQLAGLALAQSDRALAFGEQARELANLQDTRQYQQRLESSLASLPGPVPRPGSEAEPAAAAALPYSLPVEGRLLRGVGEISDGGVHSRGLTFETEDRARVIAPANGRIVFASPFGSYDHVVIIDHGGGWSSVLTHLETLEVDAGQIVRRGATIGRAGSGSPVVSVELRREGDPVPVAQIVAG